MGFDTVRAPAYGMRCSGSGGSPAGPADTRAPENGPRGHVAEQLGQDIGLEDPCPIVAGKKVLRL